MIVKYDAPNILTIGGQNNKKIVLIAGNNIIDDQLWDELAEDHPIIQHKVNNGLITIIKHRSVPVQKAQSPAETLQKMKPAEAIAFLDGFLNMIELRNMAKTEKRKKVLAKINDQIKLIDSMGEQSEDNGDQS
jgi:hypothetical protein